MALLDDINAEPTNKGRARIRATAIRDAIRDGSKTFSRGRWSLTVSQFDLVRDGDGLVVGIEVFVRVYRDGIEVRVDPHRRIVNPPVLSKNGGTRQVTTQTGDVLTVPTYTVNVRAAILDALLHNIQSAPNPAGWVAP